MSFGALSGQTLHFRNLCSLSVLAPVSLGEKSVSILCSDELNSLRRQTFDVSNVTAGQDDVTGLISHLGDRRRQEEIKKTSAEEVQLC